MYIEFLEDPAPQAIKFLRQSTSCRGNKLKQRKEQGFEMGNTTAREAPEVEVVPELPEQGFEMGNTTARGEAPEVEVVPELPEQGFEMGNTTAREAPEVEVPELPEDCIAHIISFTSPKDACVSALVSKAFQSAADSDEVWEKFLPPDYKDILSRSVAPFNSTSKKELYFRLCSSSDPVLLDGGTKSLRLEKTTGKKCLMLGARELGIIWGGTPQYWQWRSDISFRFAEVAELIHVCWLDISGKIETRMLSPKTTYGVYIVIKHADQTYGLEEPPVDVSVSFVGGGTASGSREVYLERSPGPNPVEGAFPSEREDGWMEIEVGEFYNDLGEDGEVQVSVREVNHLHWKRGLIVEGIEFRPW